MKPMNQHLLLYDQDCPLCKWYTQWFVTMGWIDSSVRSPYQEMKIQTMPGIDMQLARNKIALYNIQEGKTLYGIDAMAEILKRPFPWIGALMSWSWFYFIMKMLYSFISFNRKIIVPVSCSASGCNPARNWFWRSAFVVFAGLQVSLLVGWYFTHHLNPFYIGPALWGDAAYFTGQLLFQFLACKWLREANYYDYIGHLAMVSLSGAWMLFVFGICLNMLQTLGVSIIMLQPFLYGVIFTWMFFEHRRRLQLSGLDERLTWFWLLYRLAIYPLAFTMH